MRKYKFNIERNKLNCMEKFFLFGKYNMLMAMENFQKTRNFAWGRIQGEFMK